MQEFIPVKNHMCEQCMVLNLLKKLVWKCMHEFIPAKNHVRTVCGDKFTQKASLVVHARIHNGEKPCVLGVVINLLRKLVW